MAKQRPHHILKCHRAKPPVVKAKVTKVKQPKRMSKGVEYPWEVWSAAHVATGTYHAHDRQFSTKARAEKFIKDTPSLFAPVIVYINIPAMEY